MTTASPLRAFHMSNLLTYGSLLSGIAAMAAALEAQQGLAGALIALAVILDTFDGRFARLFRRSEIQRATGAQLDSLADAIAFGVAPTICAVLLLRGSGFLWWGAVFLFALCAITRLAFYNVTREATDGFIGLPVPVAALVWASALLASPGITASTALLVVTGAAMVLPLRIPRPAGPALLAFACWPVAVLVAHLG